MNTKTKIGLFVAFIALAIDLALYALKPLGDNSFIAADLLTIIFSSAAVAAGIYALKFHDIGSAYSKLLWLMVTGVFFWAIGEMLWGYQEILLNTQNLTISIADIFYLLGYPFFIFGIYSLFLILKDPITSNKKWIVLLVIAAAAVSVGIYGANSAIADPEQSTLGKAVTIGYVILDSFLLFGVIAVLLLFSGGKLTKPWIVILVAFILLIVADLYYTTVVSTYVSEDAFTMLWDAYYVTLAFGFFYYRQTAEGVLKPQLAKAKKKMKS